MTLLGDHFHTFLVSPQLFIDEFSPFTYNIKIYTTYCILGFNLQNAIASSHSLFQSVRKVQIDWVIALLKLNYTPF